MQKKSTHLVDASAAAGVAVDGPALADMVDSRFFGSALFNTVFTLVNILLNLFSFSFGGTDGPPCAGELMMIEFSFFRCRYSPA
jgi:hypothetical protein